MNVEPDGGGNLSHETRHPSLSPEPSPDQATEWTLEANEGLVFADNECVAELGLSDLVALPEEEDDNDFYAQTRRGTTINGDQPNRADVQGAGPLPKKTIPSELTQSQRSKGDNAKDHKKAIGLGIGPTSGLKQNMSAQQRSTQNPRGWVGRSGSQPNSKHRATIQDGGKHVQVKTITWNMDNQHPHREEVKFCVPKDGVNFDLVVLSLQQTKVVASEDTQKTDKDDSDKSRVLPAQSGESWDDDTIVNLTSEEHRKEAAEQFGVPLEVANEFVILTARRLGQNWRCCASDHTSDDTSDVMCVAFCRNTADVTIMNHTHQNTRCSIIAMRYEHTRLAFLSCKFPHRSEFDIYDTQTEIREKRNRMFFEIIERSRDELSEECNTLGILEAVDHSFWMGSFNYDIDMETHHILAHVDDVHVAPLMGEDELTKARVGRDAFVDFSEGEIEFLPSAPCEKCRGIEHISGKRPGYYDRILWQSAAHCFDDVIQKTYTSAPNVSTSRHKPIVAIFTFPIIERDYEQNVTFEDGLDFIVDCVKLTNGMDLPEKGLQFRIYTNPPNLLHTTPVEENGPYEHDPKHSKFGHFPGLHRAKSKEDALDKVKGTLKHERTVSHHHWRHHLARKHHSSEHILGLTTFRTKGEVLKGHVDGFTCEKRSKKDQKHGNLTMDMVRFRRKYGNSLRLKIKDTPKDRWQLRNTSLVIGVMSEARVVGAIQVPLADLDERGQVDYDTLLPMRYHYARLQKAEHGINLFFEDQDDFTEGIKLHVNLRSMKEQPRRRLGLHTLDADTTSWVDVKSELLNGKHTRFGEDKTGVGWLKPICEKEQEGAASIARQKWFEKNKWLIRATVVVPIWIIVGTLFYYSTTGWTSAQSFYFCIQSGFSIGYGAYGVTCEEAADTHSCEWYTVFHVLLGSTFIGVALGLWATHLVADSDRQIRERQREMVRKLGGLQDWIKGAAKEDEKEEKQVVTHRETTNGTDLGIAITFAPPFDNIGKPFPGVSSDRNTQEAFAQELRLTLEDVLPAVAVETNKFRRTEATIPNKYSKNDMGKLSWRGSVIQRVGQAASVLNFNRFGRSSTTAHGFELPWTEAEVDLPRSDDDEAVLQFQAHVFVQLPPGLVKWNFDDESLSDILLEQLMHSSVKIQGFRVTDVCPIKTIAFRDGFDGPRTFSRWERFKAYAVSLKRIFFWILAFFLMIGIGVFYGMRYMLTDPEHSGHASSLGEEPWSLSKGILFSLTAMSTGGLVAPSIDDRSMWFTGLYSLFGVPIYGALLGSIGSRLSQQYQEDLKKASLKRLTDSDREALMKSGMQRDVVDWGDFLQIMVVKLGLATQQDIEHIRRRFDKMDLDHNGLLSRDELEVELAFSVADLNEDGRLGYNEFVHLCVDLWSKHEARARKRGETNRMDFLRKLFDDQEDFGKLWSSVADRPSVKSGTDADGTIGARELKDLLQALSRRAARTLTRSNEGDFAWDDVMSEDSFSESNLAGRTTGFDAFVKQSIV